MILLISFPIGFAYGFFKSRKLGMSTLDCVHRGFVHGLALALAGALVALILFLMGL